MRYGKYWNKQGTDKTLRDNWKAFAKAHDWRHVFKYQDVVEPQQQNTSASAQNSSSSSGVDVGSVLNDVSTGLEIFTAILAIFQAAKINHEDREEDREIGPFGRRRGTRRSHIR